MNTEETHNQTRGSKSCLSFLGGGIVFLLGVIGAYFALWALGAFLVIADPQKTWMPP